MSSDRDTTRIVRSWLDEGTTVLPDRVLDAVLDQVPATPQRRAWWPAWRFPPMNTATRIALAAVVVVAIAFFGIRYLLPGNNIGGPAPVASPTLAPTPMPGLDGQDTLSPGRYQVDPTLPMKVSVAVPRGWSAGTNWVVIGPKGNQAPDGMAIRFYTAENLFVHPLSSGDGLLTPPVGPTADDLFSAMVSHPDWTTTTEDRNSAITIFGYDGKVLHLTLPASTSQTTPFNLFGDATGPQEWGWDAGQLFDIYVVNVGGKRLVIDAFHYAGTSQDDLAAQQAVFDSIQLAPLP